MYFPPIINRFLLISIHLLLYANFLFAQDYCNLNTFTIEEEFFNDEIVAFYLGTIDINTGSSNVLLSIWLSILFSYVNSHLHQRYCLVLPLELPSSLTVFVDLLI